MRKRHSAASDPAIRPVNRFWLALAKHRRIILAVLLCLAVGGSGTAGYLLASSQPALAAPIDDTASIIAFNNRLADQDNLCATVEQINLEKQLAVEQDKADSLEDSLITQQEEIDSLEETILNALMANLSDQMIARSSSSIDAFSEEASNLLDLSRKLTKFESTDEASKIDLTTYEAAIDKRLLRLPTLKPIRGGLDGYGWRRHPVYRYRHFHPGVDMDANSGTKIKAAATGYVTEAQYSSTAGNYIKISHGNGFTTVYMHCRKLYVQAGQTVDKGEYIGEVGNTGTSTGPHLHFEIRLYGNPVNPKEMIME